MHCEGEPANDDPLLSEMSPLDLAFVALALVSYTSSHPPTHAALPELWALEKQIAFLH